MTPLPPTPSLGRLPLIALLALLGATTLIAQPSLFRGPGTPETPGPSVVVRHGLDVAADVLSNNPGQLWIDLPDAPAILVEQTDFEQRRGNGLVWRGHVPYASDSQVVLTRHKGLLAGTINIDGDTYEIAPGPGRSQAIQKLDIGSFPACEGGPAPPGLTGGVQNDTGSGDMPAAPAAAGAADPNAEMHLLAMYTPQARDGAGGVAQIEATIQAAVDNANTAFANSNMFGRYVLVHTALANYNDSSNLSADLNWIDSDPATASLRNQYGADMVSLIVNSGGCGIGYVQRNPGSGFAGAAFQVTVRSCAVGNLTFAHEHGHNLGFEHDPDNSSAYPGGGSFDWSFGSAIGGNVARTVMAYPAACTSNCPRLMYHSNPDIFYSGFPTGNAADRDNARTGDTTAYIVHDFRPDATPATLVSISVAPTTADIDTGDTQAFTATGHYDDATTDDLTFDVTWASSNTAVASINTSGLATGQGDGTAGITASLDGVTSTAASITVTTPPPATLVSIDVTPASASIEMTETQVFTATGNYDDASTADITGDVAWASSNPAVAIINGSGVATGMAAGSSNITASLDGVVSAPAALTVAEAFTLSGFSPSVIGFDTPTPITISGTGFVDGASLSFQNGSGKTPTVSSLSVDASTTIIATVSVSSKGKRGDRNWQLVVTNGGSGASGVVPGSLLVTSNLPANSTPVVSITAPGDGNAFANGALVSFAGSANDNEDGDISSSLSWSSSLNGVIGSGASFSFAGLSEGVHTITASATDSGAATGSALVSITVGNPPPPPPGVNVVSINPATADRGQQFTMTISGSGFASGASVSFENGSGPAPTASNVVVAPDGNSLTATVQIQNKGKKGPKTWDVRVTNPDSSTGALAGALFVTN